MDFLRDCFVKYWLKKLKKVQLFQINRLFHNIFLKLTCLSISIDLYKTKLLVKGIIMQKRLLIFLAVLSLASYVSCNKSSSDGGGTPTVSSLFKAAFPEEAAVSSPTAQKSASVSMVSEILPGDIQAYGDATDTADKKKEALTTILDATSAEQCSVNINLYGSGNANCYGPNLDYQNHPEGGGGNGQLPGGDLGLWDASETSGEACAAAELNSRMKGIASQVDTAFFSVASMMCAAKNASLNAPENAGESLDVTSAIAGKVKINNQTATVSSATLAREADSNGKPVYVSTIVASFGTKSVSIRLKHIPAGKLDEATFNGKLSIKLSDSVRESGFDGNCSGSSSGQVDAVSIIYEKNASGNMKYALASANFCGSAADPYKSATNYSVDLSKTYNSNNGGWGNNGNVFLADFNPNTGIGTYQYAWQAGRNDSNTRVMNMNISTTSTAVAYFGFGPAITSASGVGTIDRMICNWAGPGSNHTGVSKVQKQVMTRSSTMFTASSSAITYDPVTSCDSASGSFTFKKASDSTYTSASSTTANLVNLSEVSTNITNVSAPSDVD